MHLAGTGQHQVNDLQHVALIVTDYKGKGKMGPKQGWSWGWIKSTWVHFSVNLSGKYQTEEFWPMTLVMTHQGQRSKCRTRTSKHTWCVILWTGAGLYPKRNDQDQSVPLNRMRCTDTCWYTRSWYSLYRMFPNTNVTLLITKKDRLMIVIKLSFAYQIHCRGLHNIYDKDNRASTGINLSISLTASSIRFCTCMLVMRVLVLWVNLDTSC